MTRTACITLPQTLTNKTLISPTINGTVATTGLTLPAFTTDGNITMGAGAHLRDVTYIYSPSAIGQLGLIALNVSASAFQIYTRNLANDDNLSRLYLSGGVTTAVLVLENTTVAGLVLSGALTLNAQNLVADTTTGTEIATAADQKLGFYGATPVVQQTKAGHNDWAAVSDVVNALVSLGFFDAA